MIRIRYTKTQTPGLLMTTSIFATTTGKPVQVFLINNTEFRIVDIEGNMLVTGESKNLTYLKRAAKQALKNLVDPATFQNESRKKRESKS